MTDDSTGPLRVSVSSLNTWRECPRRYHYQKERRLTLAGQGPAVRRELGSWWHALRAADSIARARSQETVPGVPPLYYLPEELTTGDFGPVIPVGEDLTAETIHGAAQETWSAMTDQQREDWIDTTGAALPDHLREMDERWTTRWAGQIAQERVIAVEMPVSVLIPAMPQTNIRPVFTGRVDEVIYDMSTGMLTVRDIKSSREIPGAESAEDMLDSQLHLYAWAVSVEMGRDVQAVSYDRARTKPASSPKLTQAGSLSKSVTDYDLLRYLDFTSAPVPYPGRKKDGSDAGEYTRDTDVVDRLRTPREMDRWNRRTLSPVNHRLVRSHLREAALAAWQRASSEDRPRALSRRVCQGCDFLELCLDEMRTYGVIENVQDYGLTTRPE